MSRENEAHRDWHVVPSVYHQPDWWTVGYTYEGNQGRHQGEFVPVHHWGGKAEAEAFAAALLAGLSRDEAKRQASEVRS